MRQADSSGRARALVIGMLAAAALSACGSGGSDDADVPPPTALPASLTITAPASADVAGATQFGSSASALAGLKFSWDFGDGSSSTDAAPSHSYAKGGDYKVTLHVVNEAGTSVDTQYSISVNNMSLVQGLVCSGAKQAGWCWEQPTPSGADRYDTFFIDANTGWTVGSNGTILKTTDAGATWTSQASGVDISIKSVRFADASNGWALGDYGALLRTTDGGTTWIVSKLGNGSLVSLQVFDAKTLLARDSYNGSYPMVSTDGGLSWQTRSFVPTQVSKAKLMWTLTDGVLSKSTDLGATQTQVLDARLGYSGGNYYYSNYAFQRMDDQHLLVSRSSQGYVNNNWVYTNDYWRSQDGGASWDTPAMRGLPDLSSNSLTFVFAGPGVLIANVNGVLYRSEDAGGNWSALAAPFGTYYGGSFVAVSDTLLISYGYSSAYISVDAGKTWTTMAAVSADNTSFYGILSSQAIGAQGLQLNFNDGSSYRSSDLGQTWTRILAATSVPNATQLRAFWAFDAKHALGVSANGQLLESQDGGRSWAVKQTGLNAGYYTPRIVFATAKVGWLYLGDGRLYRSSDGGETWVTGLNSNFYASNFQFIDELNGFAVNGGRLSQSKDGGLSWTDVGDLPSNTAQVSFQSATHGLAVGYNGIAETSDGGLSWTPRYTGSTTSLNAAIYTDAKTAWALGGNSDLLQSTDGGSTWQRIALPVSGTSLTTIQFLDAKLGWISGQGGIVLATVDGGKTWQRQATDTSRSLQVQFVDSRTGWVLGENGALLATGTGGN